ncbi:unnamed protein product, partial [Allacma fusca]
MAGQLNYQFKTRVAGITPGNQKLLGWILLASAFDGIIFLILIIFDLAKVNFCKQCCGFFKRGAKEWLNSIIAEAEAETETEPGTPERPK